MNYKLLTWMLALALVFMAVLIAFLPHSNHWSMVYEAIQVPELVCDDDGNCVPGDQKRFVLFNEDGLTKQQCIDLFDEHLRRLNNNAAVIEYEISCDYLATQGHGIDFQYQNQWLL